MTDHTCYYGTLSSDCPACKEEYAASPAGIIAKAIETLDDNDPLGDLLQTLSDEMGDEHAEEREFPNHVPAYRWQVCDLRGGVWRDESRWTEALAVARHMLGMQDPNAAEAVA